MSKTRLFIIVTAAARATVPGGGGGESLHAPSILPTDRPLSNTPQYAECYGADCTIKRECNVHQASERRTDSGASPRGELALPPSLPDNRQRLITRHHRDGAFIRKETKSLVRSAYSARARRADYFLLCFVTCTQMCRSDAASLMRACGRQGVVSFGVMIVK